MKEKKPSEGEIKKALLEVAKVVESTECVDSVRVTITFKKPKSNKANNKESK